MAEITSPEWEKRDSHSEDVVSLLEHNSHPILFRVDEVTELDGTYYRSVVQVASGHEHEHTKLFESPILDSVNEAYNVLEAFADHPMRYARMFFDKEKHGK